MDLISVRRTLDELIRNSGDDYASLSRLLGRNPTYIQQFIKRGVPRRLSEEDRRRLALHFGIGERLLGGATERVGSATEGQGTGATPPPLADFVTVEAYDVGASAGAGALAEDERAVAQVAFRSNFVRSVASNRVEALSTIRVEGDSMLPTLADGDQILVDTDDRDRLRDGIYVLRTGLPRDRLDSAAVVLAYKSLARVEHAFRSIKTVDIEVRPVFHYAGERVRAHVFLCMLAYYVEWQMRRDLAPVLFQDEELDDARWSRDPVAKAEASQSAKDKKKSKMTEDGWPVHSWQTLLAQMATRTQNQCRAGEGKNTIRFELLAEPTPFQRHVFGLAGVQP